MFKIGMPMEQPYFHHSWFLSCRSLMTFSLWEQVAALKDAPAIRAPLPDLAAQLADHRVEAWLEDRAFGTDPFAPEGPS